MADLFWALHQIRNDKEVRRKVWPDRWRMKAGKSGRIYLVTGRDTSRERYNPTIDDTKANDWAVFDRFLTTVQPGVEQVGSESCQEHWWAELIGDRFLERKCRLCGRHEKVPVDKLYPV